MRRRICHIAAIRRDMTNSPTPASRIRQRRIGERAGRMRKAHRQRLIKRSHAAEYTGIPLPLREREKKRTY